MGQDGVGQEPVSLAEATDELLLRSYPLTEVLQPLQERQQIFPLFCKSSRGLGRGGTGVHENVPTPTLRPSLSPLCPKSLPPG